ncbi:ATP-binding cassette domain-containing protein [Streptococcus sp. zg-86]|uniref:ATP-binding cassette domain-containing protein n=1 Tax=Streptococcus zhangguiae TaxID=2664091 RepID=A0A6I4RFV5_9STRE|nr:MULTISPECIES: ATP-binding cassette domain-containing protein [unclassified Streptococcus]MTB64737.1 ATP-binding cassette domain-containing protein [Streptococcus sp. zg-86]MTB91309.1 ATP-binding cassette domain-containing protein [Streptococcus sp. zg-36]MTB91467.1 ATP-binding cassette domain-containing protein [Streptococcus sp. zg-36]MWV56760.1 ATP-binding cassette domain-containing protein [Streptococcus sp. zg-70]QTH48492.1 ABC-F family ATP-binding cassette domain-containing protein [St
MLQITHLTMTHEKDLTDLVSDLSLVVNKGDKIALIGEEGNGKSSLLKWMMNPTFVNSYIQFNGQIRRDFGQYSYIPQQLPQELERLSLNDYFFGPSDVAFDYAALYRYAKELQFDSDRFADAQLLSTLSGGEKLKIQFIKELAKETDILFLDEPSNDLDLATLKWLERFIQQTPKTVIFVSHDETFLRQTATKIIHLERIKKRLVARTTVQSLDYATYAQERKDQFDRQLQQARNERLEHQKKLARHHRIHQSVEYTVRTTHDATAGRLIAKKMKAVLAQEKRYEKEAAAMTEIPTQEDHIRLYFSEIETLPAHKPIIELVDYSLQVGQTILVPSVDFRFLAQEKIGIIGANGAGKSSLLRQIYRMLKKQASYSIGYIPQNYPDLLNPTASPLDFLTHSPDKTEEERVLTHLASLQFSREEARHPISSLSGGQQAKLLLLKMVLETSPVLLLDEPTRNFSPTSQPQVRQLFQDFKGAILAVSHDRTFLKEVCDRVYQLNQNGLTEIRKDDL